MGIWQGFLDSLKGLFEVSGLTALSWENYVMIGISCFLLFLAIKKQYEPLLLLPIAFGMLIVNLYPPIMAAPSTQMIPLSEYAGDASGYAITTIDGIQYVNKPEYGGLFYYLYQGVKLGIYPPLIFLGIGCMTDFGPLIANPKSFILGAAAQVAIFITFIAATLMGFSNGQAGSIGIIGGADGPTAIFVTTKLAPELLGPIAVAAYSYMALVPIIQPPIMKLLTTKKERSVVMQQLRPVSKLEKILFPIIVTIVCSILLPSAAPLIGMLMLGNLFKESGVVDRIFKTAQNELMNIITIFLGLTVGATATGKSFLSWQTLGIIALGLAAFSVGTASGVLFGKLMYVFTKGKVNPLIGAAGVSAVPMAARVANKVGQKENPSNFLLMHAMGPNVAGVIGSAVAAGVLLSVCG
ncbi:MAG: sodium ion-translocating decarboxylase subunit beta [Oscillospiraceae bacterium]|nr:sodium ion-translocating decarboxylase subunit beta [Oscillospiraceae bacterium]